MAGKPLQIRNLITPGQSYNMPTFSANDIVGKTLIARKSIPLKRLPQKSASTIYTAKPGITVGVVYSWVEGDGGLWWMYYDQNGRTYYTFHEPGAYDIKSITAQGVESLEQVQEQQDKKDDPVGFYISKFLKPVTYAVVGYFGLKAVLDIIESSNRPKRRNK